MRAATIRSTSVAPTATVAHPRQFAHLTHERDPWHGPSADRRGSHKPLAEPDKPPPSAGAAADVLVQSPSQQMKRAALADPGRATDAVGSADSQSRTFRT